jgi:hypothetical protein
MRAVLKTLKRMGLYLVICGVFAHIAVCFCPAAAGAASADFIPWSGHWWPFNEGGLATGIGYRGHPAPLEKYLLLTTGNSNGALISWYRSRYYDPAALDWEGMCPYWARASIMEAYEILPSSEENLIFRVGDKKGLLTLCHDGDVVDGGSGTKPVVFHRWLLYYIGDQKTSFTADLDGGPEVWFFPIYRYGMSSSKNGRVESVSVTVYYASDNVSPDYMGTAELRKSYTYNLFLNAAGEITDGEWTGRSVADHPQGMAVPLTQKADSPYIDYTEVRRIAQSRDDYLEVKDNAAARIAPGNYNLILLNEDQYTLTGLPGDEAYIEFIKDGSSKQSMLVDISNHLGESVLNQTLAGGSLTYQFTMEDPPYSVTLTQNDYKDPNIYTLTFDQSGRYRQNFPMIPKAGEWIGFAITNAGDETAKDVILTTCSKNGLPLQTVWGPVDLMPGEKQTLNFDALPWRLHELKDTDSLILTSSHPVDMVSLFGITQQATAGFAAGQSVKNHLIIPDIYRMSSSPYMRGAIVNELFEEADIVIRLYAADGTLHSEISDVIPLSGKYDIAPGQKPFYSVPEGGWVDIVSSKPTRLSGHQYLKSKNSKGDVLDTLFALPVRAGTKIVPNITPKGRWRTTLTLINPNNKINQISLHPARAGSNLNEDVNLDLDPFEKRVIDLSGDFGKTPGDPLYRSILEISGKYPVSGYYTFSPSKGGDKASFPLLDEDAFKSELVMPHYAGGNRWWTGVDICNPNLIPVQVLITPYDLNGEAMAHRSETIEVSAGAYVVFDVKAKYGEDATDIAFLKITAADPDDALIGGYYLYGNRNNKEYGVVKSLGGANM